MTKTSLAHRTIVSVLSGTFLVTLIFSILLIVVVKREYSYQFKQTAKIQTNTYGDSLIIPMWNYDIRQVEKQIDAMWQIPGFCGAEVKDPQNKVLYSNYAQEKQNYSFIMNKEIDYVTDKYNQKLGMFSMCFSLEPVIELENKAIWLLSAMCIMLVATMFVAINFSIKTIIVPLEHIKLAMSKVAKNLDPITDPLLNKYEEIDQVTTSFNNMISDLKTTRDGLISAKLEAEKANMAKTEFLTNITHELRTPIHAILSYADLGNNRQDLDEKIKKFFTNIKTSGDRLLRLVNDLLDLAKAEAGKIDYNITHMDITKCLNSALDETANLFALKNIKINKEIRTNKLYVNIDERRMMQVIVNILSNAQKFSPNDSEIKIIVSDYMKDDKPFLKFEFIDQGVGIDPNELEVIFDKFIQSSRTKTGAGGTGLGLPISRELVTQQGGYMWAENNTNSTGSDFIFILPAPEEK